MLTAILRILPSYAITSVTMLRSGIVLSILLIYFIGYVRTTCNLDRGQELQDEGRLETDLLCDYNSDFRPVKDHKNSITIRVRLALKYITFDSMEETITIHSWLALMWKDEFLTWTPSDYGNLKELPIESHKIWTPQLALFNADASTYQSDYIYTTCLLSSDGTVTCVPHTSHTGICRSQLRNWPYDEQKCSLYFGAWIHTGEQINFTFYNTKPVMLDDFQNGPGWKLLNVSHVRLPGKYNTIANSTYPMLQYTFHLAREAGGPAAIVVVPTVIIILLTLTSLLLDIKDNTRLVLACVSLFAHFIFLTEIGYDIPKHSSDTPIILLLVRDSMIITLMVILVTLFLMSLRHRTVPTPSWIMTFSRLVSSGPGKYVVFTEFDPSEIIENKAFAQDISGSSNEERSRVAADWIQFANVLNSCIFIISLIVYLVLICTYVPRAS